MLERFVLISPKKWNTHMEFRFFYEFFDRTKRGGNGLKYTVQICD